MRQTGLAIPGIGEQIMLGAEVPLMIDKAVRTCALILVGAICLYLAAHLISSVWPILAIMGGIGCAIWIAAAWWRWRQSRW